MRRIPFAALIGCAAFLMLTAPAQAKGEHIHARVIIQGPGLASPIVLSRGDADVYLARSGAEQAKWDVPNIGGTLTPGADLGPAFIAVVHIRCGRTDLAPYRQALYPQAPQGLQVYTPLGATSCVGQPSPGYWPAHPELLSLLVNRGLQGHATRGGGSARSQAVAAAGGDGSSGGSGPAVVAFAGATALAVAGLTLIRSRRRNSGRPAGG